MSGINYQMKMSGLSMNLQQKVRKYFEFLHYQNEQKKNSLLEYLVLQLPKSLKEEVLLDLNKDSINQIKIFKNLSKECLNSISLAFKQKIFIPEEVILQENKMNDSLFYINQGQLEIYSSIRQSKEEKIIQKSIQKLKVINQQLFGNLQIQFLFQIQKKRDTFGFEGFLLGEKNPYNIKSIGSSILSYIEKETFYSILRQFPQDYEKYCYIQDEAIFSQVTQNFQKLKCISCGQSDHQLSNCPYVSVCIKYKPSKIICQRIPNFIRRKQHRSYHVLKSMSTFKEKAMAAVANNDSSLVIDCISFCQNYNSSNEKYDEPSSSTTSLAQNNTNVLPFQQNLAEEFLATETQHTKTKNQTSQQNLDVVNKSTHKRHSQDIDATEKKMLKSISFKAEEKVEKLEKTERNDQVYLKLLQERLSELEKQQTEQSSPRILQQFQQQAQQPQSLQIFQQQTQQQFRLKEIQKQIKSEESLGFKGSMRSIKIGEESLQKEKLTLPDKLSVEKTIFSQFSEKLSSQPSSSQQPRFQINTSDNKQAQDKYFEQPETILIRQTFTSRQKKAEKDFKILQKSISERIYYQKNINLENIAPDEVSLERLYVEAQRKRSDSDTSIINQVKQEMKEKGLLSIIQLLAKLNIDSQHLIDNKSFNKKKDIKCSINNNINNPSTSYQFRQKDDYPKSGKSQRIIVSQQTHSNLHTDSKSNIDPFDSSTEYQIRCKLNLQDLDMLVVRKNLQMMQQKNEIKDYIEVPDNEMDIDQIHNFIFYYRHHNLKQILYQMKLKAEERSKQFIEKRKARTSVKKKSIKTPMLLNEKKSLSNILKISLKDSIID